MAVERAIMFMWSMAVSIIGKNSKRNQESNENKNESTAQRNGTEAAEG